MITGNIKATNDIPTDICSNVTEELLNLEENDFKCELDIFISSNKKQQTDTEDSEKQSDYISGYIMIPFISPNIRNADIPKEATADEMSVHKSSDNENGKMPTKSINLEEYLLIEAEPDKPDSAVKSIDNKTQEEISDTKEKEFVLNKPKDEKRGYNYNPNTTDYSQNKETIPKAEIDNNIKRIMNEIVHSVEKTGQGRKNEIKIKLKPEYLGEVHIEITESEGKIHAKIKVLNDEVREVLENGTYNIENTLKNQGINIDRIELVNFTQENFIQQYASFEGNSTKRETKQNSFIQTTKQKNKSKETDEYVYINQGYTFDYLI